MPVEKVVVIHMMKNLIDVDFLFPVEPNTHRLEREKGEEPFSEKAIAWLHALSLILSSYPETRLHPDVATFAFFCRKANLMLLKKQYYPGNSLRTGRGLVFHITPKNVPTTFAYSLVCGILSGNANSVKVPSRMLEETGIICRAIQKLGGEKAHQAISSRQALVRYDHQSSATAYFSSICDVRIIWGGDATIDEIRKHRLSPRAFDIAFASRNSLCIINADRYIRNNMPGVIATGFYNDTYLFDQEACTSPNLIVWIGSDENIEIAKSTFWANLHELVKSTYHLQPHAAVDKLTAFYRQTTQSEGLIKTVMPDNLIWRTELRTLPGDFENYHCGGGYFSECKATSLSDLSAIISGKYQTLCYYGFEKQELIDFIALTRPNDIDSIVPIGRTTEFSLTRDGYNLIDTLSSEITVI